MNCGMQRIMLLTGFVIMAGCMAASKPTGAMLSAPSGTDQAAARHNDEGLQAYGERQWDKAKRQFDAAIEASPTFAEAHYNLGMVLYRMGALREGDAHFMKTADLAPGNAVIWDSPPLRNVMVPEKASTVPGSTDGHGHGH
jgi:Flp pilus assembly protein TadD